MKTRRPQPRGGATVELAILMIVLVPTIMYTLFLEDLLVYKLDQLETVSSTPWDFAFNDFRENSTDEITGSVRQAAMQTYWDHTSAWNTYQDANFDAKEKVHHQALTAHQCWLAEGGQEVACSVSGTVGMLVEPTFNFMNRGGLASCNAVLGVQNYFLPMQIFGGKFSKRSGDAASQNKGHNESPTEVSMTGTRLREKKWEGQSGDSKIHDNAKEDSYVFPKGRFGVLHDPWALNRMEGGRYEPLAHPANLGARFTNWMNIPYGLRRSDLNDAKQFADDAIDAEFLQSSVKQDIPGRGDNLDTPALAWKADPSRQFTSNHGTSAWSDNRHRNTQSRLQDYYMGMPQDTW